MDLFPAKIIFQCKTCTDEPRDLGGNMYVYVYI